MHGRIHYLVEMSMWHILITKNVCPNSELIKGKIFLKIETTKFQMNNTVCYLKTGGKVFLKKLNQDDSFT